MVLEVLVVPTNPHVGMLTNDAVCWDKFSVDEFEKS
jgi:hypothetical protein